jgi:hypothetical protein
LAYQPPASSTFLSEQISHQQPASTILLSEDISTGHPVRLAYQPPASSTFLSEQISHQQPASTILLSEDISTGHQQNEQARHSESNPTHQRRAPTAHSAQDVVRPLPSAARRVAFCSREKTRLPPGPRGERDKGPSTKQAGTGTQRCCSVVLWTGQMHG